MKPRTVTNSVDEMDRLFQGSVDFVKKALQGHFHNGDADVFKVEQVGWSAVSGAVGCYVVEVRLNGAYDGPWVSQVVDMAGKIGCHVREREDNRVSLDITESRVQHFLMEGNGADVYDRERLDAAVQGPSDEVRSAVDAVKFELDDPATLGEFAVARREYLEAAEVVLNQVVTLMERIVREALGDSFVRENVEIECFMSDEGTAVLGGVNFVNGHEFEEEDWDALTAAFDGSDFVEMPDDNRFEYSLRFPLSYVNGQPKKVVAARPLDKR